MMMRFQLLCFALVLLPAGLFAGEKLPPPAERKIDFARDVQPILADRCYDCHGADLQQSNYRLDVKQAALSEADYGEINIVPGKSAESPLIRYTAGLDDDLQMPPDGEGDPLTAEQISILRAWIDQGADWPEELSGENGPRTSDHWSLQPLVEATPPKTESEWPLEPLDRFILAKLHENNLQSSPPADRTALIRRVYLDMLGLPPSRERVEEFINDNRPDAYALLIEEVLSSPRYGERWAQHWLDVVRFAETDGFEVNTPRANAWPYRDYVIKAFNDDKPYDKFVYEQLAGDLVGENAATGFLVAAPVLLPGQIGKDEDSIRAARQDALDEMITATSATFLGLTVGCARCHNHKFDPILQKDYYSLQAVFAGVQYGERPLMSPRSREAQEQLKLVDQDLAEVRRRLAEFALRPPVSPERNEELIEPIEAKFVRFVIEETNNLEPCLDELEIFTVESENNPAVNVALSSAGAKATSSGNYPVEANHRLEHINDGQYGNGRSWISSEVGSGWVQIELAEARTIDRIVWGRDRQKTYSDRLAVKYRIEAAVQPGQWKTVASSASRLPAGSTGAGNADSGAVVDPAAKALVARQNELERKRAELAAAANQPVFAGTFSKPPATFRLRRGDHKQPLEELAPDTVELLGTLELEKDATESSRRHALANWIIDPENPLTARVMVNRIWHYHFGQGLVDTPSDFGKMGGRPSHPELLDYLAREFIGGGWSIKNLHRTILRSRTYQQSARTNNETAQATDADNRLLWRYPARRLEAEAIRDSALQVSGVLRHEMGGPGFQLFKPREGLDLYQPKETYGPAEFRRLIYAHKVRMEQDGVFTTFDMPDCGQLCSKRSRSTTPLQALNLFNSSFMMQQAELFARRIEREAGDVAENQVKAAFQLALTRDPRPEEATAALELVRQHGLTLLCRVILNTNEFVTLP